MVEALEPEIIVVKGSPSSVAEECRAGVRGGAKEIRVIYPPIDLDPLNKERRAAEKIRKEIEMEAYVVFEGEDGKGDY